MLGRVRRPSISSLELLAMEERPSPKLIKHDPLSIYETTLLKLKEGSQRCQSLPPLDPICSDVSCITANDSPETIGADCSSTDCSLVSSGDQSMSRSSTMQRDKNFSVLYLFSKYRSPKNATSSPDEEAMMLENVYSSTSIPSVGIFSVHEQPKAAIDR